MSHKSDQLGPLIGRLLLITIFLVSGVSKIFQWSDYESYMSAAGMPAVPVFLALAMIAEILGGLALLFGFKTRWAAVALAFYLVPVTLIFHAFWSYSGAQQSAQLVNFFKNLAIIGGLLMLAAFGAGRFSLDAWLARRKETRQSRAIRESVEKESKPQAGTNDPQKGA